MTKTKHSCVFLSRLFSPHRGGVEKHVESVAKELLNKGYEVSVITEQFHKRLKLVEIYKGIKVFRIPYPLLKGKMGIWSWMIKNAPQFSQADIIHCHDVFWWYLPLRIILFFKPVFTTFHGYEKLQGPSKKTIFVRKLAEKLSFGNICIGGWMKKWYLTSPSIISYGGADIIPTKVKKTKDAIFLGRFAQDTGVLEIICAVDQLKGKVLLDVYGMGEFEKQVQKACSLSPFCSFKGEAKDSEEIFPQYRRAFVSQYLSIIEAVQSHCEVFAYAPNELKKDYIHALPIAKHLHMFSSSLEFVSLLNSSTANRKYHLDNAFSWAKQQTWKKVVHQYEDLWKKYL